MQSRNTTAAFMKHRYVAQENKAEYIDTADFADDDQICVASKLCVCTLGIDDYSLALNLLNSNYLARQTIAKYQYECQPRPKPRRRNDRARSVS